MKNNLTICCDLDGTFHKIRPLLEHLNLPFYVITGCQDEKVIKNKLKGSQCIRWWAYSGKFYEDLDIYLKKVAVWKAKMVKKLKADIYIDDDHRVLREVSRMNPKTTCLEVF